MGSFYKFYCTIVGEVAILQNIATVVYVLGLIGVAVCLVVYLYSLTVTRVPFLWLSHKMLPEIVDALQLAPNSVMYELGSGDARVLLAASKRQPSARYIGVDIALAALAAASFRHWRAGSPKNVTILKNNFFKLDLSDATHIYCFIYPEVMSDLHQKFLQELTPGTRLVSCNFQIADKKPSQIIPFKKQTFLAKTLYVYEY